jgi:hypothetical protein
MMTPDEIVDSLKTILSKKSEIATLEQQRRDAEVSICQKYQVDACNAERNASGISYQNQIQALLADIKTIQDSIDSSLV